MLDDDVFFQEMSVIDKICIRAPPEHRFTCFLCVGDKVLSVGDVTEAEEPTVLEPTLVWIAAQFVPRAKQLKYEKRALKEKHERQPLAIRSTPQDVAMLHHFYAMLTRCTYSGDDTVSAKFGNHGSDVWILDSARFQTDFVGHLSPQKQLEPWLNRMRELGFVVWKGEKDKWILRHPAFQLSMQRISLIAKSIVECKAFVSMREKAMSVPKKATSVPKKASYMPKKASRKRSFSQMHADISDEDENENEDEDDNDEEEEMDEEGAAKNHNSNSRKKSKGN